MRLDRDAALALEVHRVEDLRFHLARLQRAGHLEEPVRERRLAVVDVGDDREVADETLIHLLMPLAGAPPPLAFRQEQQIIAFRSRGSLGTRGSRSASGPSEATDEAREARRRARAPGSGTQAQ